MDTDIVERLDRLIGLYELVNAEQLEAARAEARSDPATAAILERTDSWVGSGTLKSEIAVQLNTSEKTVQRRILELVTRGALVSRRTDRGIDYRATGVI